MKDVLRTIANALALVAIAAVAIYLRPTLTELFAPIEQRPGSTGAAAARTFSAEVERVAVARSLTTGLATLDSAGVFVVVTCRVTALREPLDTTATLSPVLRDARGREYELSTREGLSQGYSLRLAAGIPARLYLTFEVPGSVLEDDMALALGATNIPDSRLLFDLPSLEDEQPAEELALGTARLT